MPLLYAASAEYKCGFKKKNQRISARLLYFVNISLFVITCRVGGDLILYWDYVVLTPAGLRLLICAQVTHQPSPQAFLVRTPSFRNRNKIVDNVDVLHKYCWRLTGLHQYLIITYFVADRVVLLHRQKSHLSVPYCTSVRRFVSLLHRVP